MLCNNRWAIAKPLANILDNRKNPLAHRHADTWANAFVDLIAKALTKSGDHLVKILLKTRKHLSYLVRSPEIRNGIGDRVVVPEP